MAEQTDNLAFFQDDSILTEEAFGLKIEEDGMWKSQEIENPEEFVKKSAEEGVITVPGAAFGQNGENHVRMSYANSYENIAKAMDILEKGE